VGTSPSRAAPAQARIVEQVNTNLPAARHLIFHGRLACGLRDVLRSAPMMAGGRTRVQVARTLTRAHRGVSALILAL
jgi:hypothetical protein